MKTEETALPYQLISTEKQLIAFANSQKECKEIAIDTESNSLFVYHEHICLIQFTTEKDENVIIDPIAVPNLSPLAPLFESSSIQKIFHAAEYDILCLKRDYEFTFNNIFDTMVAARILKMEEVGLAALLERFFQIRLDKKYQKANWGKRPLPDEMLDYAVNDTLHLRQLKNKFASELQAQGLSALAEEDFRRLCALPAYPTEKAEINWWNASKHWQSLSPEQAKRLQALCNWRETIAQKANIPPFKLVGNTVLAELAEKAPLTEEELEHWRGLHWSIMKKHKKSLLQILSQPQNGTSLTFPPERKTPKKDFLARKEKLKEWRKNRGIKTSLPSDVILPKEVMEQIIRENPRDLDSLQAIMADYPYRFEQSGNEILKVLRDAQQKESI